MGKIHKDPVTSPGTERDNASVPCTAAPSPQTPPFRPALLLFVDLALQNCMFCMWGLDCSTQTCYLKPEAGTSSRAAVGLYSAQEAKLKSQLPELCNTWHPRQTD